jgi:hypothetical protein
MSRRHVLGDLNTRCEAAMDVPVLLNSAEGEVLGYVDESLGKYADAFTFHLEDAVCKKLATGHFTYSFEFEFANESDSALPSAKRRIRLVSIYLVMRKGYDKPVSKSVIAAEPLSVQAS